MSANKAREPRPNCNLTWDVKDFETHINAITPLLTKYIQASQEGKSPAGSVKPINALQESMKPDYWIETGGLQHAKLTQFVETYLQDSARLHHPHFMGHQVATPAIPSALAELLHGSINNPMAVYEMGPSATCLEDCVLAWMIRKVGWSKAVNNSDHQQPAAGVLTHGGSLANLTALLAARAAVAPSAWEDGNPNNLVVLAPKDAHYSIARAASIMGLGARRLVTVPTDRLGRIIASELSECIDNLKANGHIIMCLVANACATSTGLFDDLKALAPVCQRHSVWLHVDACHGGAYLLSDRFRERLAGIELADSITWDAHKMMRVSALCAAVLVRRAEHLKQAFTQQADYLLYENNETGIDFSYRTIECTKAALGTKLFLTLAWAGEKAIGRYIDRQTELAHYFYKGLVDKANYSCPYEPESNILCFRYKQSDERQLSIKRHLLESGQFHIGTTTIFNKRYLRLTLMNPHTKKKTLKALTDAIEAFS